tara:strand:- start:1180 stop:1473 length:294 start_codon:yes stop_codon:yes gene_type:complete
MDETAKKIVSQTREKLLSDFPKFLELERKERFFLGEKIDSYCTHALNELKGHTGLSEDFSKFVDILYGCKQLADFGEKWAPNKEKVEGWLEFLKNFK